MNWYRDFDLKLLYSCIFKAVVLDFESPFSLKRKRLFNLKGNKMEHKFTT